MAAPPPFSPLRLKMSLNFGPGVRFRRFQLSHTGRWEPLQLFNYEDSALQAFPRLAKDAAEYPFGEFSSLCVLLAGMVRSDQNGQRGRETVERPV